MDTNIIVSDRQIVGLGARFALPRLVQASGETAWKKYLEFFLDTIRNENTRAAYARNVKRFFDWLDQHAAGLQHLSEVEPLHVATVEEWR